MSKNPMTKNIFLIVIDSLRSDHFFNKKPVLPNLTKLSENGIIFSNAITSADGTALSLGSMFSSLYPFETGLGGDSFTKWNQSVKNHITKLHDKGYQTVSSVPESVESFGLVANFDDSSHSYDVFSRLKDGLGDEIIKKLQALPTDSSWFYYLHLLDLHQPVWVPEELDDERYGESQYERMISSIDVWLGRFFDQINLENTIIVITADHGEYLPFVKKDNSEISFENIPLHKTQGKLGNLFPGFMQSFKLKLAIRAQKARKRQRMKKIQNMDLTSFERRSLLNTRSDPDCYLYDELVKIPLLIFDSKLSRETVSEQVRTVDIFPTIFDLVDIKDDTPHRGINLLGRFDAEIPCYIESAALVKKSDGDVIGIRTPHYKYFRAINNPKEKTSLFDLVKDPLEENNISKDSPDIVSRMENVLAKIMNSEKQPTASYELDDVETKKIEKELRKLGYI